MVTTWVAALPFKTAGECLQKKTGLIAQLNRGHVIWPEPYIAALRGRRLWCRLMLIRVHCMMPSIIKTVFYWRHLNWAHGIRWCRSLVCYGYRRCLLLLLLRCWRWLRWAVIEMSGWKFKFFIDLKKFIIDYNLIPWVVAVCWPRGIARRALTARRWSRRDTRPLMWSSSREFSIFSWCRHESSDATKKRKL